MQVIIYNMFGSIVQKNIVAEGQAIKISQLAVGTYTVVIKSSDDKIETETLVKMKWFVLRAGG